MGYGDGMIVNTIRISATQMLMNGLHLNYLGYSTTDRLYLRRDELSISNTREMHRPPCSL
jgi:hypothetical protein